MGFVVKNTILRIVWDFICPNTCLSCGKIGSNLCECCKKNIKLVEVEDLVRCSDIIADMVKMWCGDEGGDIKVDFYAGGYRVGAWQKLIYKYKFSGDRLAVWDLAGVLKKVIPCLGNEVILVAMPTIARHVRERGFDHAEEIVRELGQRKGWRYEKVLERAKNTVQVGSDAEKRIKQGREAVKVAKGAKISPKSYYLVVDDVFTTGASVAGAIKALREAGAQKIGVAVLAISE